MRLFRFFNLVLQTALSITHAASKPHPANPSEVANPHDLLTDNQLKNGSQNCGPDGCSSQTNVRPDIFVANQVTHEWESKHFGGPTDDWRLTPDTMRESGAQEFFFEWLKRYQVGEFKADCNSRGWTAIQCFARMWWGVFDFRCTIDQIERCSVPKAGDFITWIGLRYNWPPSRVTDTARKAYFIYKHFQMVTSDLKSDWEIILLMGTTLGHEAHITVDNFTPQHSKVKAANCQLAKDMVEMVVDLSLQTGVMALNAGQFSGSLAKMSANADMHMANAKKTGDYRQAIRAAQQLNLARNSMYYTQWTTGQVRKGYNSGQRFSDARYGAKESKLPEREVPRLEFPLIKGHGTCGNLFGVHDDNSASQVDQLVLFIHDQLHAFRYTVEQVFNSLFVKEQEDLGDVALEDIMGVEDWHGRSTRSYEGFELKVRSAIRNMMVSELVAASRQYLKCEDRDDAVDVCKRDRDLDPKKRQSLYCPPNYPRLRCQAAYWTKKQMFNHDKQLPGLEGSDSFSAIGIDLPDLFSNSVERFFAMGIDSYSSRSVHEKGVILDPAKMAHLPVSVSKVKTVHPGQHHHDFPFSCGDWTSSCTTAFMDRVNINVNNERGLRGGPLFRHLKLVPEPANRFLLLCNLKVSWPNSAHMVAATMRREPSVICEEVKKAIQDNDEFEGNYRFCNLDMVHKHVFKYEMGNVMGRTSTHRKLCQRWIFENSLKITERFGLDAIDEKLMAEEEKGSESSLLEDEELDAEI